MESLEQHTNYHSILKDLANGRYSNWDTNSLETKSIKSEPELTYTALINILEDFTVEKKWLDEMQKGMLNILEDLQEENYKSEQLTAKLQNEIVKNKAAELKLRESNQELESFSYSVSHDLRAPLRHIAGYIDLLNKQTTQTLDEKSLRYFSIIEKSVKKMGNLIDELLAFSRLGRTSLKTSRIKLNDILDESMEEFEEEIYHRNIIWKIDELPEAEADPVLIRQVFINLLSNALKYTQFRDPARIEITSKKLETGYHLICIKDNGVGFDDAYLDKLFCVFQRLHSNYEFEGIGIGLANVKRIITKHGGEVCAEGKENEGAAFYFTLKPIEES